MTNRNYRLTPVAQAQIVAFIRAGAFPHAAAEAAGIPAAVFDRWLSIGSPLGRPPGWKRHKLYTTLWDAVLQAVAQSRVAAEVEAHRDEAVRWLMSGPGRDRPDAPGWSHPVRPRPAAAAAGGLNDPALQKLFADLVRVLEPFPEAREAAAKALAENRVWPGRPPAGG
ncbi:MAG: hypothetical protein ACRC33_10040 [Gemmataceae bacterium]